MDGAAKAMGFKTKTALAEEVRGLVARQRVNRPVTGADLRFLLALFRHHYQWADKCGPGVAAVEVRWNHEPGHAPTKGLWLTRADGSEVDISWRVCLDGKNRMADLKTAFRHEVGDQVRAFAEAEFLLGPVRCPVTDELVPHRHGADVDHAPPVTFDRLVADFLAASGLSADPAAVPVEDVPGRVYLTRLADRQLGQAWQEFHRSKAVLRVLSRAGHRQVTSEWSKRK